MKIFQAILVAVVVGFLLAIVLGPAILLLNTPITDWLGHILKDWGWQIGVFAGLWFFFFGGNFPWPRSAA